MNGVTVPDLFFTLRYGDDAAGQLANAGGRAASALGEAALTRLLGRLGVPGSPALALEYAAGNKGVRVYVEDGALPLPDSDVLRLHHLYGPADSPEGAGRVLAAVVARAAEASAAQLVGDRQNLRWIEAALARHPEAEPIARYAECTRAVLRALLAQGIAITDVDTICRYLVEGLTSRRRTAAIAESLIARLQPATLDIEIDPALAERLLPETGAGPRLAMELPEAARAPFELLRDGLFHEAGVRIPPVRIVPAAELPADTFRVRSGAVGWTPWPMPDQEQNALEYIALTAARDVRRNAGVLLDIDAVEGALAELEGAFPELVYAALEKVSATDLTRVLRKLLAGDVSIRNFRSILERLLVFDWVATDLSREIVFDTRLPVDCRLDPLHEPDLVDRLAEYVRSGLRTWISYRSRGPDGTLRVRLLDPDTIERPILDELAYRQAGGLGQPLGGERLDAIRQAIADGGDEAPVALLTIPPVASFLRDELRASVPQVPVLSYQELAWDVTVEPVARISL